MFIFSHDVETGLDDVVSVDVYWELEDVVAYHCAEEATSLCSERMYLLQQLLKRPCPMLIHRNHNEVFADHIHNLVKLMWRRNLYQLLAEIVRELVNHQYRKIIKQHINQLLTKDEICLLDFFVNLFLEFSAASLFFWERKRIL